MKVLLNIRNLTYHVRNETLLAIKNVQYVYYRPETICFLIPRILDILLKNIKDTENMNNFKPKCICFGTLITFHAVY